MKNIFKTQKFRFLTVTLIIVVVLSDISQIFGINIISSSLGSITTGMQRVSAEVTKSSEQKTYEELIAENKQLKAELSSLRFELSDYKNTKEENLRLWKYFDLKKEDNNYKFVPVKVIRRDSLDDFYSFTADRGSSDGVSLNDPVISQNGLVGYVSELNASYSKVTTILSPDFAAGAKAVNSKECGVISGNAIYSDRNLTTFTKLSSVDKLKTGEQISTTGIGGMFPENIPVGKVKKIEFNSYDASMEAVIEPFEDVRTLTDAVFVTDFKGKGKILSSEENK